MGYACRPRGYLGRLSHCPFSRQRAAPKLTNGIPDHPRKPAAKWRSNLVYLPECAVDGGRSDDDYRIGARYVRIAIKAALAACHDRRRRFVCCRGILLGLCGGTVLRRASPRSRRDSIPSFSCFSACLSYGSLLSRQDPARLRMAKALSLGALGLSILQFVPRISSPSQLAALARHPGHAVLRNRETASVVHTAANRTLPLV